MRQFEQDWLELGRRVACSLHYRHPRNLRLLQAWQPLQVCRLVRNAEAASLPRRADRPEEHRARIERVEQARVDGCLDRLGGCQRLAVHALRPLCQPSVRQIRLLNR
jgi:hypothetical protein